MQRRDDERPPEQDYEAQPESAGLGGSVQDDTEETLVQPSGTDPLDASYVPPECPYGLDDNEATGAPESLGDRLRRAQPEESFTDIGRSGRLVIADAGAGETSDSLEATDVGIDGGAASAEEAAMHELDTGIDPESGDEDEV